MELHKGMRVKVNPEHLPPRVSDTAVIHKVGGSILVVFDKPHREMHDGGLGPNYDLRCWWVEESDIIDEVPGKRKIIARGKSEVNLNGI